MIVYFFTRPGKKQREYLYVRLSRDGLQAEIRLNYAYDESDPKLGYYKEKIKAELMQLYNMQVINDQPAEPTVIKHLFLTKTRQYMLMESLGDYVDKYMYTRYQNEEVTYSQYQKYVVVYNHLADFLDTRQQGDINLQLVDKAFILEFESFLRQFNNHNTAKRNLRRLKTFTTYLYQVKRYIQQDPFVGVNLSLAPVVPVYLTSTELMNIVVKNFSITRLEQVRDLFLFQCFTGLSYADAQSFDRNNLEEDVIRTVREKTGKPVIAYVYDIAMYILKQYNYSLPKISNQKMNAYLKEIADICHINKTLTSHVARHTYATTVNLNNGVSLKAVQLMLGHSTVKQTEHYAQLQTTTVISEGKKNKAKVNKIYGKAAQLNFFDNKNQTNGEEKTH